jgi:uncharacterized protein YbcI
MPDPDAHSLHGTHGEVLTAISDGMVALLKEYYGLGPTQAKTYYHDDIGVCLLRGGFTRVEQTLLDGGRGHAVIQQRMEFQEVMRDRFTAVVEHATGRPVIGIMSGKQQDPDMICEVFVLSPTDLVDDDELSTKDRTSVTHTDERATRLKAVDGRSHARRHETEQRMRAVTAGRYVDTAHTPTPVRLVARRRAARRRETQVDRTFRRLRSPAGRSTSAAVATDLGVSAFGRRRGCPTRYGLLQGVADRLGRVHRVGRPGRRSAVLAATVVSGARVRETCRLHAHAACAGVGGRAPRSPRPAER